MKKRSLFSLLAAGLLAAVIAAPSVAADGGKKKAAIGQPAPAFSLQDQNGKTVSLSDHAGKVVVLEWFNEGCPYVQKFYNVGAMNDLAKRYQEKGVVWLAVNTAKSRTPADVKSVADKWSVDRSILVDDGTVAKAYGAKTTPHMFVIDKEGKLVYSGAIDNRPDPDSKTIEGAENYVAAALDAVLAGSQVTKAETKPYGCSVKY